MSQRKHGLKMFGMALLAALGLMAFAAAGALASSFLILKSDGGLLPTPWSSVPIVAVVENALSGSYSILKLNLSLSCHKSSASGKIASSGHGHLAISFSECLTLDSLGKLVTCELNEPISANVLTVVILHNGHPFLLITPLDGLTFATITHTDELCPLSESAAIKGSLVASISNGDQHNVVKLISTKEMLALFTADKLTYGSHEAHLNADATVQLTGAHDGLAWGATTGELPEEEHELALELC